MNFSEKCVTVNFKHEMARMTANGGGGVGEAAICLGVLFCRTTI
jgi:hypothetical protein